MRTALIFGGASLLGFFAGYWLTANGYIGPFKVN